MNIVDQNDDDYTVLKQKYDQLLANYESLKLKQDIILKNSQTQKKDNISSTHEKEDKYSTQNDYSVMYPKNDEKSTTKQLQCKRIVDAPANSRFHLITNQTRSNQNGQDSINSRASLNEYKSSIKIPSSSDYYSQYLKDKNSQSHSRDHSRFVQPIPTSQIECNKSQNSINSDRRSRFPILNAGRPLQNVESQRNMMNKQSVEEAKKSRQTTERQSARKTDESAKSDKKVTIEENNTPIDVTDEINHTDEIVNDENVLKQQSSRFSPEKVEEILTSSQTYNKEEKEVKVEQIIADDLVRKPSSRFNQDEDIKKLEENGRNLDKMFKDIKPDQKKELEVLDQEVKRLRSGLSFSGEVKKSWAKYRTDSSGNVIASRFNN